MKNKMIFLVILAIVLAACGELPTQAVRSALATPGLVTMPVKQVVVYEPQSVAYSNFSAGIFAQGQIGEAAKLPAGSEVSFYIDTNRLGGPTGLKTGSRCTSSQASADYFKNTITMDKRFCADFNDAILDGRSVYGMVPTEDAFIHKANGERCSWVGFGGETYMINPASPFVRNYIVKRGAEKMDQYGVSTLFLDDLRAGWSSLISKCGGGNPKEYPNLSDYDSQFVELARYVKANLPGYKVEGNLGDANPAAWDRYSFLDGAMCESCFSDWGRAFPSASTMLSNLSVMDKWVQAGRKVYIVIQPPNTTTASNRFAFAAALLTARADGMNVYFHFGAGYNQFYSIPEYQYAIGMPVAPLVCVRNICTRQFQYGSVSVDFSSRTGTISLSSIVTETPTSTISIPATATRTATALPATVTATFTVPPTVTLTRTPVPVTVTPVPVTSTATAIPTVCVPAYKLCLVPLP